MRGKKQNVRLWAVAFWLIVWQLAAMALHAAYPHGALLLPSPVSSLARLISLAGTAVFWCAIGTSSMHILGGFLLSCALAVVLAALSARFSRVKELLAPSDALALDEPFTGLDAENREAAMRAILRAAETKIVILSTHEELPIPVPCQIIEL